MYQPLYFICSNRLTLLYKWTSNIAARHKSWPVRFPVLSSFLCPMFSCSSLRPALTMSWTHCRHPTWAQWGVGRTVLEPLRLHGPAPPHGPGGCVITSGLHRMSTKLHRFRRTTHLGKNKVINMSQKFLCGYLDYSTSCLTSPCEVKKVR